MKREVGCAALLALPLALLLALPVVALLIRAPLALPDGDALEAVWVSLRTSTTATAAILLFGTPLALLLARPRLPLRRALEALVILPAVLPPAAAGLALLLALGRRGIFGEQLRGLGLSIPFTASAVVLAQVYVAAPFFVRPLTAAFRGVPSDLEEAARIDGAEAGALFWRIALPLVRRPLAAALTLAWARALGEFGATALFAGSRVGVTQTLPLAIYLGFETDIDIAASLSVLLLAVATIVIGATLLLRRGDEA